jgi:ribonucleoside-diphosphate reductase alpha chain
MSSPAKQDAMPDEEMYVTKRDGQMEIVSFDKILRRLRTLGQEANIKINYTNLVIKVIDQLYDGISTTKIDELSAEQCASMSSIHPDYNILAGRIIVSNHHKNTSANFKDVMNALYKYRDKHDQLSPLVTEKIIQIAEKYDYELNIILDYERDYLIDYFGFKTLERAYLMKINKKIVERPQHMWLRVAIGIHGDNFERICETYEYMSQKYFTHATPTLFNAGTPHPQLSSCFLLAMESDSIEGIYNTLKDCALISKWAGGIGLHVHNIRASGSHIRGTNGQSNGLVPMLKVFNNTAKYVDQCVHPETIIYTTQGPKQIQHCVVGETEIFNLTGDSEVIQNVLEHSYEGEFLEIDTMHSLYPLRITPEHPVFVLRGQQKGLNYKVIKNRLDKKIANFEWVDAKDLSTTDMMIYPIPTYKRDISNISADDCYIYGVILGDGSMCNKTESAGYVSIHTTNKKHVADFMENYFTKTCTNFTKQIDNNTTIIRWNRSVHLPFRYNDFYDETKQKRVQPKWLNLPIEKAKYILKGLIDTDGCLTNVKSGELVFDSTSINLIESVRFLCMRMGVLTSGYIRDRVGQSHETARGIIENKKISYCLRIPKTREICDLIKIDFNETQFFKYMRYGDFMMSRIQDIRTTQYQGVLYDLQMSKEHNYMIENGLVHNGGGKRNGSFAIYLEPWHADIEVFLQMRKNHGDEELKARDLFYALWVPDLFMERIKADGTWTLMCPDECPGLSDVYAEDFNTLYKKYENEGRGRKTVKARELWFQILDAQMETGTPYLCYKDACNKKSNQKNLGTIKSSNLCVAPETTILTDKGHKEIQDLKDQTVNVWNGEEFSEVQVFQTGVDQELIEVETNDGCKLTCTPYHKFFIQKTYNKNSVQMVEAKDLNPNDKIMKCKYPVIDGKETMNYAYTHGFFCGDGTYTNANLEEKQLPLDIAEKFYVPLNHSLYSKLEWFAGYCDADGTISVNGDNKQLQIASINHEFLMSVKMMLQTCGINPKLRLSKEAGTSQLPDGKGGHKDYVTQSVYRLLITSTELVKLVNLGFSPKRLQTNIEVQPNRSATQFIKIKSVQNNGRRDATYCFKEPKRHAGVFNGILTSQCTEIIEYSDDNESAVCNLASIALPTFIDATDPTNPVFDFEKLHTISKVVTYNLNKIIDVNYYPTEKTKRSNMRHRPIGIGVQGLADVFMLMNMPFMSAEAKQLNKDIFETIYHGALEQSCEMAKVEGAYETFQGSPASEGILQFDMWQNAMGQSGAVQNAMGQSGADQNAVGKSVADQNAMGQSVADQNAMGQSEDRYDWTALKTQIIKDGLRNSLLMAPMPTASTSQILGFNECIEPITSNIYNRRTLAGEFILANKYLMNDLIRLDLWNEKIKNNIIANHGSVQHIDVIPVEIREKYKTVWEIPMRTLIDMAADRGVYICQSQSLNLWLEDPNYSSLTSMHFYSWSKGLKTGIYYLRRRGRHQAQQFTIEPEKNNLGESNESEEICDMCSA